MDTKKLQISLLLPVMEFMEKHASLLAPFTRPLANLPLIAEHMPVLLRAYLGATAFEIHDVDLKRGRIGIGGVEEIMAGAKIIELLHTTLGEKLAEEEKQATLYGFGEKLCRWEFSESLRHNRWVPEVLVPLIVNKTILDDIESDPQLARFMEVTMNMVSKLITDEGGWGHLDFQFSSKPMRVTLTNSQEAHWFRGSQKPVCHFYAGIIAGYTGQVSGEKLLVKEISCAATGAEKCTFEVYRQQG